MPCGSCIRLVIPRCSSWFNSEPFDTQSYPPIIHSSIKHASRTVSRTVLWLVPSKWIRHIFRNPIIQINPETATHANNNIHNITKPLEPVLSSTCFNIIAIPSSIYSLLFSPSLYFCFLIMKHMIVRFKLKTTAHKKQNIKRMDSYTIIVLE